MKVTEAYINLGPESRPGILLDTVMAVVMHWTGVPGQTWQTVRGWWDNDMNGVFGSAHEIIDVLGNVYLTIPDNEVSYGVGADQYTEYAKRFFGQEYTSNKRRADGLWETPNLVTLSLEMMPVDTQGNFSKFGYISGVQRAAYNLKKNGLTVDQLLMHSHIRPVSEKVCPKLFVEDPAKWEVFKMDVRDQLKTL